jgi:hypothetical protein
MLLLIPLGAAGPSWTFPCNENMIPAVMCCDLQMFGNLLYGHFHNAKVWEWPFFAIINK